ncbi:MAG: two-component system phosphate regulon sensor histidine kinase PhoR [Gammaproteobacteria bacterium]
MLKILATESGAIFIALFAVIFLGVLTSHWTLASIAVLLLYIVWLYCRLLKLEKWLSRGTRASEVYDDNGFVGIVIRHLYRQKKLHNDRKKRTKEMLGRLNRNISALPDATVLLNRDREIEWCNEPAQYLLAIHARNDLGQRITNLIRHPEFMSYLNAPEDREHIEITAPGDPGLTLQVKLVQFGDSQYLLIARNVSDQKLLQEGLKNFVAYASHELKSPLTVLSGHLEMLEDESALSESGHKSLQIAQRQSLKMKELIEDLLMLSEVESYHLQPDEGQRVDVQSVLDSIVDSLQVGVNQGRIQSNIEPGLSLLGIRSEIQGICANLIENALKYSPAQTSVSVSWSKNSLGEPVFSVTDSGSGISSDDLPYITDRYFRSSHSTAEQIDGSGLGLSIVNQAAHKHGAILSIESRLGKGSVFTVIFPSYRLLKQAPALATVIRLADY